MSEAEQDLTDSTKEAINQLNSFSTDAWVGWVHRFLTHQSCDPELPATRRELHHVVIGAYHNLSVSARDRLAESLAILLGSTQTINENVEEIYYLLQLVSYISSPKAGRVLHQRIFDGSFADLQFANGKLDTVALDGYAQYGVDDELVDFILRSARGVSDLRHLFACWRALSKHSGARAFGFLEYILPHLQEGPTAAQLHRQLRGIVHRVGYKPLFQWYSKSESEVLNLFPEQAQTFRKVLQEFCPILKASQVPNADPYLVLLSTSVHASQIKPDPKFIIALANLRQSVGEEIASGALRNLYACLKHQYRMPWAVFWPHEDIVERSRFRGKTMVVGGEGHRVELDRVQDQEQLGMIAMAGSSS